MVAGLPREWNKTVWDSRGNFYSTFVVYLQQQRFVFKLLKGVCSDFTDII